MLDLKIEPFTDFKNMLYRCSGLNGRDFDRFIACVNGYVNLKTLVIVFNDVTEWVCDYLICWLIYLN